MSGKLNDKRLNRLSFHIENIRDVATGREILRTPSAGTYDSKVYLTAIKQHSTFDFPSLIAFRDGSLAFQLGTVHLQHRCLISKFLSATHVARWSPLFSEKIGSIIKQAKSLATFGFLKHIANPEYRILIRHVCGLKVPKERTGQFLEYILHTKDLVEPYISVKKMAKIQDSLTAIRYFVDATILDGNFNNESLLGTISILGNLLKSNLIVGLMPAAHATSESLASVTYHLVAEQNQSNAMASDLKWLQPRLDSYLRLFPTTQTTFRYAKEDFSVSDTTYTTATVFQLDVPKIKRSKPFLEEEAVMAGAVRLKCPLDRVSFGGDVHKCHGEELALGTILLALNRLPTEMPAIKPDFDQTKIKKTAMVHQPQAMTILNK